MYRHLALSDSGFLFDTRTGSTYSLNRTGTWLVRALIDDAPADQLPSALVERFDVADAAAHRDVERFLYRLRELALVDDGAGSAES